MGFPKNIRGLSKKAVTAVTGENFSLGPRVTACPQKAVTGRKKRQLIGNRAVTYRLLSIYAYKFYRGIIAVTYRLLSAQPRKGFRLPLFSCPTYPLKFLEAVV